MTTPVDTFALWSVQEVKTQAEQCRDQLTVWEILDSLEQDCDACNAKAGEACRPGCLGVAALGDA